MTREVMYQKNHDIPSPFPNFPIISNYMPLSTQSPWALRSPDGLQILP